MNKYLIFSLFLSFFACQNNHSSNQNSTADLVGKSMLETQKSTPPSAEKISKILINLGESRTDQYYWLNERENPKVISYLEAENKYADAALAPIAGLRKTLFDEMKARIQEDDSSVPYFKNGYWYYSRVEKGKEYGIFCRKKAEMTAPEEVLIDVNKLAEGHEYCAVPQIDVSPDNNLMFFTIDYSGRGLYKWFIKNLQTGEMLADTGDSGSSSSAWLNDSKSIIYDTKDAVTLRYDKIWKHRIGTAVKQDELLYHETDETQYVYLSKSKSDKYIFANSAYTQTVEVHYLDADAPNAKFKLVKPREKDFFYSLDHANDKFYIRTNKDGAKNFKLMSAPIGDPKIENWVDFLPHRADILLENVELFKDFLVLAERKNGLNQLKIMRWDNQTSHYLDFGESTYEASVDINPEFETDKLRYRFSSLKTPSTVVEYDMKSRVKKELKVQPVLGGFDTKNYQTEFAWATAKDGTKVPISLVFGKNMVKNGKNPCLLIGYGSYGMSYDPSFNREFVSLLDRGFVVGIAHIRGGMEFGYAWYEEGKLLKKMNTFTDFIDCADFLVKEKYTSNDRLFASGRSAGGLLMGAVANLRPDLFRGILAGVPFVDVLTTMSDPTIPLTTGEYSEWGNPARANEWAVMKTYSPYDQVTAKNYPNILVTTSLGDSQVQYFEPAKWVAKLRELKTDDHLLLLKTNMSGSHGGASGRFKRLDDRALEYGWILGILGMNK